MIPKSILRNKTGIFSIMLILCASHFIKAQSARDTLNQYIAELQKTPDDNTLRGKIIVLSQRIKPAPAISGEAREKYVMAITLRNDKEYELSISQLKEALLIAPWWGEAYKELGITFELAEKYTEAINAFQLFIKTNPGAEIENKTKDEISIMKAKKMKADNVRDEPVIISKKNLKAESLKGNWYGSAHCLDEGHYRFDVIGDNIFVYMVYDKEAEYGLQGGGSKIVQAGFETPEPVYQLKWLGNGEFEGTLNTVKWNYKYVGIESEDGTSIRFVRLSKSIDLEHNTTWECLFFRK